MDGFNRLKDQVAIVTGGYGGIGFAIAKKLASEGAKILITDIIEEKSKSAVKELCDMGYTADSFIFDVKNVEEIYKMTAYCEEKYGQIDILINNACLQKPCPSMKLFEEDFDRG